MMEVNPTLGLQDQVHHSDEYDMVSGGPNNSEEMPTSIITSILDGHWELGNSTLSYGEGVNVLCSKALRSDVPDRLCPNRCSVHSVLRSVYVSATKNTS